MAKAVEGHRTPRRCARHDDFLKYAKRLGLRQPPGAWPDDNMNRHISEFGLKTVAADVSPLQSHAKPWKSEPTRAGCYEKCPAAGMTAGRSS
jgi:hypothetical protein